MQLLLLTQLLLKEKILFVRLLAASAAGGIGAVLILVLGVGYGIGYIPVSYTHLRAHETSV